MQNANAIRIRLNAIYLIMLNNWVVVAVVAVGVVWDKHIGHAKLLMHHPHRKNTVRAPSAFSVFSI